MILIFNSCFDDLHLGLVKEGKLISKKSIPSKRKHSEIMVDNIRIFLEENNVTLKEIETLYLASGPGSFTGTRLSLVFAKTQQIISNIKILTIDSLSSLVGLETGTLSVDARSGKFYTADFKKGKLVKEIRITNDNFSTITPNENVVKNMFNKIHFANKYMNFKEIKIDYIKKL